MPLHRGAVRASPSVISSRFWAAAWIAAGDRRGRGEVVLGVVVADALGPVLLERRRAVHSADGFSKVPDRDHSTGNGSRDADSIHGSAPDSGQCRSGITPIVSTTACRSVAAPLVSETIRTAGPYGRVIQARRSTNSARSVGSHRSPPAPACAGAGITHRQAAMEQEGHVLPGGAAGREAAAGHDLVDLEQLLDVRQRLRGRIPGAVDQLLTNLSATGRARSTARPRPPWSPGRSSGAAVGRGSR